METCEYLIPTIKENCQTDNNGKCGKKLLLCNYVPFSLIYCHSNKANYAQGWGFCFSFSTRGRSFALNSCRWGRNFEEKSSGLGVGGGGGGGGEGGMVTSHIDTCIYSQDFRGDLLRHSIGLYHFITNLLSGSGS